MSILNAIRRRRRGSVMLLAIASLAILSVVALSYVTITRLDRQASFAYANSVNFDQQVRAVADEIGAIIGADLAGNKIYDRSIPRQIESGPGDIRVEPTMFEDAEFADYPSTAIVNTAGETLFNLKQNPTDSDNLSAMLTPGQRLQPTAAGADAPPPAPVAPALRRFAVPDDAWLSPTEPLDADNDGVWDTWAQVTNLRSAYRWRSVQGLSIPETRNRTWVRDDGRFVDLGQWFEQPANDRADPGADLADFTEDPDTWLLPSGMLPPRPFPTTGTAASFDEEDNGPWLGLLNAIYSFEMDDLFEIEAIQGAHLAAGGVDVDSDDPALGVDEFFPTSIHPSDTRRWIDTDGDTFPDARWQQLDSLGNLFGLRWFVASRIIDASSLVNVNVATDAGATNDQTAANGLTPADVDLFRLLRESSGVTPNALYAHPDLAQDYQLPLANAAFAEHLFGGRRAKDVFDQVVADIVPDASGVPNQTSLVEAAVERGDFFSIADPNNVSTLESQLTILDPVTYGQPTPTGALSRAQREALWRFAARSPEDPGTPAASFYSGTAEIDLRALHGFNYETLFSSLEQNLDGPDPSVRQTNQTSTYLPGLGPDYPSPEALGPLRSKEDAATARTFEDLNVALPGQPMGDQYDAAKKIDRVRGDLRRQLTTVSGVGDFSPVPVLNYDQEYRLNDRAGDLATHNRKVRFDEMARSQNGGAPQQIRRAFESFVWALAPLATTPAVADPLRDDDVAQEGMDLNFFYGGGLGGPAELLSGAPGEFGGTSQPGAAYAISRAASLAVNLADATDEEDATDEFPTIARFYRQRAQPQSDNYATLGLRFSHGDIPRNVASGGAGANDWLGEANFGASFIGLDRQPFIKEVVSVALYQTDDGGPDPRGGRDQRIAATGAGALNLNADDVDEQLGGFLAFELGNPWPDPISLSNYRLHVADAGTGNRITIDLNADLDDVAHASGAPAKVVPPGSSAIVVLATPLESGAYADTGGQSFNFARWERFFFDGNMTTNDWLTQMRNRFDDMGEPGPDSILVLDYEDAVDGDGVTFTSGDSPIFFQSLANASSPTIALSRRAPGLVGWETVVDRLRSDPSTPANFPRTLTGTVTFAGADVPPPPTPAVDPNPSYSGRKLVIGSLRRRTERAAGGPGDGFPVWVIERAAENVFFTPPPNAAEPDVGPDGEWQRIWIDDPAQITAGFPVPEFPPEGATGPILWKDLENEVDANRLGDDAKEAFGDSSDIASSIPGYEPPSFQLFVPNEPLAAVGELASVSAFSHQYVHDEIANLPAKSPGENVHDWLIDAFGANGFGVGPGQWLTVSEQLGLDAHLFYESGIGAVNPYLGVLDPTRFIIGQEADLTPIGIDDRRIPDSLRVPLATRVFDCFQALEPGDSSRDRLLDGAININTAPMTVLNTLPLMRPTLFASPIPGQNGWTPTLRGVPIDSKSPRRIFASRPRTVAGFRDRDTLRITAPSAPLPFTGASVTLSPSGGDVGIPRVDPLRGSDGDQNLQGYRRADPAAGHEPRSGFVNTGELSILDEWVIDTGAGGVIGRASGPGAPGAPEGFLELGANNTNDGFRGSSAVEGDSPFDLRTSDNAGVFVDTPNGVNFDGLDDPEERAGLFRSVSNIVSTRSDVFIAWFVIRGYDPQRIESIEMLDESGGVINDPDADQIRNLFNGGYPDPMNPEDQPEALIPTYESRWLGVYDRSNMTRPDDRPRLLLLVELPPAGS